MKKQLKLKTKLLIGIGAGLLGATAVVTPLAITLTQNINQDDMDRKYGIDKAAYSNMKSTISGLYLAKLRLEGWDEKEIAVKMGNLNDSLSTFDEQIQQMVQSKQANTYTIATTSLMKFAKKNFNIDLVRKTRANWSEVQTMFSGMQSSFNTYMENHNFSRDKIAQVLEKSERSYNDMLNQLKQDFANDILSGVLKAKTQLISCFDSINTEIAKLAGTIRLNEFIANYSFQFRENARSFSASVDANSNRIDRLENAGLLVEGREIDPLTMNKLFVIYNNETLQPATFSNYMLPGYIIKPIYKGVDHNTFTNEHSIKIDWTAISNNVEAKDRNAATAHLIAPTKESLEKGKNTNFSSIDEVLNEENSPIAITNYSVLETSNAIQADLTKTYFTDGGISLSWDEKDGAKPRYDGFMFANQDTSDWQSLPIRALAETGIAIKANGVAPRLLKDVFATIDVEGYEPKDIIEQFVKNCDVDVSISIRNDGDLVMNKFVASYYNTSTFNKHYQSSQGSYEFGTGNAVNLEVSDEFYDQVNHTYNVSRKHAKALMDNSYRDLEKEADVYNVFSIILLSTMTLSFGATMAEAIIFAIMNAFTECFFALAMAIVNMFVLEATYNDCVLWYDHYKVPVTDYANNARKFKGSGEYQKVKESLDTGLAQWFVLEDRFGHIDVTTEEYKTKSAAFKSLSKSDQKLIFQTYRYFEVDFAKGFFAEARMLHIDPTQFKNDFADWSSDNGVNLKASFILDGIFIAAVATGITIAALSVNAKRKADAAKLEQQEGIKNYIKETLQQIHDNIAKTRSYWPSL